MAGAYALFDGPRPLGVGGQQVFVVIGFQKQTVHSLQMVGDVVRDVTGIADQTEAFFGASEHVAYGIDGIVEDAEGSDFEVANGKRLSWFEGMPVRLQSGVAQHVGGGAAGVKRHGVLFEQGFQAFDVIAVLVRDENGVDT